jgi:hypothetical protein
MFATFLDQSMTLLAAEMPRAYARLCAMLREREARVTMDELRIGIAFPGGAFRLVGDVDQPCIELRSDRATVLDVVDGRLTLEEAVWNERLQLRGRLDDLARFHDALVLYLHGAVRCPSFPWLLECYRDGKCPSAADVERRIERTSPGRRTPLPPTPAIPTEEESPHA